MTVQVQPQDLPGPLPLEIGFRTRGEHTARRVMLEPSGGSWVFTSADPIRGVELDEDRGILAAKVKKVRRLPRPPQR
jgi:hypothetical protein